jgi:hypothetical protein
MMAFGGRSGAGELEDQHRITVDTVRDWARLRNFTDDEICNVEAESLLIAESGLLDAIRREFPEIVETENTGTTTARLRIGSRPCIEVDLIGVISFPPLTLSGLPRACPAPGRPGSPIRTESAFLFALEQVLIDRQVDLSFRRLIADFSNSLANLCLNRFLSKRRDTHSVALEPTYQGHHYYPFPALRDGPSIEDVEKCSNLSNRPIYLPLVRASHLGIVPGSSGTALKSL